MQDLYLKFTDEQTATALLFEQTAEGPRRLYQNIDVVGVIYKPSGKTITTPEGNMPEMAPLDGWHVNVRATPDEDIAPLLSYAVTPSSPSRVWA